MSERPSAAEYFRQLRKLQRPTSPRAKRLVKRVRETRAACDRYVGTLLGDDSAQANRRASTSAFLERQHADAKAALSRYLVEALGTKESSAEMLVELLVKYGEGNVADASEKALLARIRELEDRVRVTDEEE
jgi:hypothetical protein